eukprot:8174691-Alexandrium_andersonii.AAC.1
MPAAEPSSAVPRSQRSATCVPPDRSSVSVGARSRPRSFHLLALVAGARPGAAGFRAEPVCAN